MLPSQLTVDAVDVSFVLAVDIFHADSIIEFLLLLVGEMAEAIP